MGFQSMRVFETEYVTPSRKTERKYSFVHSNITEKTVHWLYQT